MDVGPLCLDGDRSAFGETLQVVICLIERGTHFVRQRQHLKTRSRNSHSMAQLPRSRITEHISLALAGGNDRGGFTAQPIDHTVERWRVVNIRQLPKSSDRGITAPRYTPNASRIWPRRACRRSIRLIASPPHTPRPLRPQVRRLPQSLRQAKPAQHHDFVRAGPTDWPRTSAEAGHTHLRQLAQIFPEMARVRGLLSGKHGHAQVSLPDRPRGS
jgi:hypothetical protein